MRTRSHVIALVTAPDAKAARNLARAAVRAKLAACVTVVPAIESHYWWQGKLEHSQEVLLVFKTTRKSCAGLKKLILERHPYDTAEFVVLGIESGSRRYLEWLSDSVGRR